eukprot:TRINITY_DN4688_c0_g1_i1.p2 TRINITY_DN4688_c0_g1~~TRINITY_DN4688_c0_g1_i1.p2  ORF type:complete len:162 (+),score=34.86 TRINITY_DN4688_c0_g1_i1:55-486(+)
MLRSLVGSEMCIRDRSESEGQVHSEQLGHSIQHLLLMVTKQSRRLPPLLDHTLLPPPQLLDHTLLPPPQLLHDPLHLPLPQIPVRMPLGHRDAQSLPVDPSPRGWRFWLHLGRRRGTPHLCEGEGDIQFFSCLLYTSPSPRDS